MTSLPPTPSWDDVPELKTDTRALAGTGGPMNLQAQALLNRTELLKNKVDTIDHAQTGHFFADSGARIDRFADRVFAGAAVLNAGTNVISQPDWLTQYQLGKGRVAGTLQLTQVGVLADNTSTTQNAFVAAAQTLNALDFYNRVAITGIGINNCAMTNVHAWGGYFEAYRDNSAVGGAYGIEIDTVNYKSVQDINPYAQSNGQTIALQIAGGGEYPSAGQFDASAAINIRKNGAKFAKGIVFGSDALTGSDGVTGTANAISLAKGHNILWHKDSSTTTTQIRCDNTTSAGSVNLIFQEYAVSMFSKATSATVFRVGVSGSPANYVGLDAADSGNPAMLSSAGADTDIDLRIFTKGTGKIWLGAWSSNADAVVNGYMTVKDSSGNIRKLATIA